MKTKILFSILTLGLIVSTFGQKPTIELIFTAIDSVAYVQLDSIKVMNRSQGGDTVLFWPDTVLSLDFPVGIQELENSEQKLKVFQNYPNPVREKTIIRLYVPETGSTVIMISDLFGREVTRTERVLEQGYHSFIFTPCRGELFFFTALSHGSHSTIKILSSGDGSGGINSLEYTGSRIAEPHLKGIEVIQSFSFTPGDELLYIGYADVQQSGILDSPESDQTFIFQFASNIPCPGTPTVTYEGQVYNTVQIFSQCWLKENLNVGVMIPGNQEMEDNGVIEKYCYDNLETNCDLLGGLYQWDEMMMYSTTPPIQDICPPDWHVPTDEEWKVLEGVIDSQYGIGDNEWDWWDMRGSDIGHKIKSQTGWYTGLNGSDSHGFTLLPGGLRYNNDGNFHHAAFHANMWSSSEHIGEYKWFRFIIGYIIESYRNSTPRENGYSVRCIQD